MHRLFLSIDFEAEFRDAIGEYAMSMHSHFSVSRPLWVEPSHYHLTLHFASGPHYKTISRFRFRTGHQYESVAYSGFPNLLKGGLFGILNNMLEQGRFLWPIKKKS